MSRRIQKRVLAGIEFAECGSEEADTLICMHGIGGDELSFLPQTEGLSDQFRVLSWNMPGYGNSKPLETLNFESLANSLKALLDALELESVHIMGQSIGGMIAQEFYHRFPEYVKSLILVATTPAFGGRDESFKKAFLSARLKPLDEGKSMAELAKETVPMITGSEVSIEATNAAVSSMSSVSVEAYKQILTCLITFNRRQELPSIVCPVCVIAGNEDTNAPAATMKKMAEKLENSEYHELAGAGHLVNLEKGQACNEIIRRFLQV